MTLVSRFRLFSFGSEFTVASELASGIHMSKAMWARTGIEISIPFSKSD